MSARCPVDVPWLVLDLSVSGTARSAHEPLPTSNAWCHTEQQPQAEQPSQRPRIRRRRTRLQIQRPCSERNKRLPCQAFTRVRPQHPNLTGILDAANPSEPGPAPQRDPADLTRRTPPREVNPDLPPLPYTYRNATNQQRHFHPETPHPQHSLWPATGAGRRNQPLQAP